MGRMGRMVVVCAVVAARIAWWFRSRRLRGWWFRSRRLRGWRFGDGWKRRGKVWMMATEIEVEVLVEMSEFLVCIDQCCLDDGCIVQQA